MVRRIRIIAGLIVGMAATALFGSLGCAPPPPQRMNAPPQGEGLGRPEWTEVYTYHNDQGMMADRSLADIHFIPGSAELSGTGVARLERYAELLATSGGTLRYDTSLRDEALIKSRLDAAADFLRQALPGDKGIQVVVGLPGGRGMSAKEAKSGQDVAQQAESRDTAYRLTISKSGG
jgi:hypothetical protein